MDEKKYRPNVGLMLVNNDGKVWIGTRVNSEDYGYRHQMPQGGIDKGETPLETAYRELWEEVGISKDKVELIKQSDHWYQYDFFRPYQYPDDLYHGQKQKWFLFRFKGTDADFDLEINPQEIEFSSFSWMDIDSVIDLVVPFKREVYTAVFKEFKPYI